VTAFVGKDGVVIGADGSATLGDGGMLRIIEQPSSKKIEIIGERMIIAGTGYVGPMQRFASVVKELWNGNAFKGKSDIEVATTSINWDLTARARVGYANDNWLFYATGGLALLGAKTDLTGDLRSQSLRYNQHY
jgi:opacity protein-like surface antigen